MTIGPPASQGIYPFARLDEAKDAARKAGVTLIDFGVGDPQDPTPAFIRQALIDGLDPVSQYPRGAGLPELRETIARWFRKRFQVDLDPATQILPTLGSKEIIHDIVAYVADRSTDRHRDVVVVPTPAYPVYERGARFHGLDVVELPLTAENSFLPDLAAVPDETWDRSAILWLNYPNNPTGATAPPSLYRAAAELADRHGVVIVSDEAYSEIAFGERPPSLLQTRPATPSRFDNLLVVNTLSKRSFMTGYRSGFIAGDPTLIGRMVRYRPSVGVTPQDFVQRAAIAAWSNEDHVVAALESWRTKRAIIAPVLEDKGVTFGGDATFFLWFRPPDGETPAEFCERLIQAGLLVTPGSSFGSAGEGFVRMALVPTIDDCRHAAEILKSAL